MKISTSPSHPPRRSCIGFAPLWSIGLVMVLAGAAGAQTPPPTPAPGQDVPVHAAGGWPSDTTGDDQKPTRTPEQQAHLDAVANELKRLANSYGPDCVVLQAKFLIRAMGAGASGATEVQVVGPSEVAGAEYLEIKVDTGIAFDGRTTTADSRQETVWRDVAAPVLDEMKSFKIEPSALELVLLYDVSATETAGNVADKPAREGVRVRISREALEKMIRDEAVGDTLRQAVRFEPYSPE